MPEPDRPLTHIDADGSAQMVDVGGKPATRRRAIAEAFVRCSPQLLETVRADALAKGNLIEVARLAGIQAAKRTGELIPLCHTLPLEVVRIDIEPQPEGFHIRATASTDWKTGVEMEALTAASVAGLTIIDMGKAVDRAMSIERIRLLEKSGGRSGDWRLDGGPAAP